MRFKFSIFNTPTTQQRNKVTVKSSATLPLNTSKLKLNTDSLLKSTCYILENVNEKGTTWESQKQAGIEALRKIFKQHPNSTAIMTTPSFVYKDKDTKNSLINPGHTAFAVTEQKGDIFDFLSKRGTTTELYTATPVEEPFLKMVKNMQTISVKRAKYTDFDTEVAIWMKKSIELEDNNTPNPLLIIICPTECFNLTPEMVQKFIQETKLNDADGIYALIDCFHPSDPNTVVKAQNCIVPVAQIVECLYQLKQGAKLAQLGQNPSTQAATVSIATEFISGPDLIAYLKTDSFIKDEGELAIKPSMI